MSKILNSNLRAEKAFLKIGEDCFEVFYSVFPRFLIHQINFLSPQSDFIETEPDHGELQSLKEALTNALQGKPADFSLDFLDLETLPALQQKILKTLCQTKPGETLSYQELALKAGLSKKHARVCGSAMAKNPFPLIIPCHRVIRRDGKIGNYSGGKGSLTKKNLLLKEAQNINFNN